MYLLGPPHNLYQAADTVLVTVTNPDFTAPSSGENRKSTNSNHLLILPLL